VTVRASREEMDPRDIRPFTMLSASCVLESSAASIVVVVLMKRVAGEEEEDSVEAKNRRVVEDCMEKALQTVRPVMVDTIAAAAA